MINNYEKIRLVKVAKKMVEDRLSYNPDFNILLSINAQLDYLFDVLSNDSVSKERLEEINMGLYAIREFEETDIEFSKILIEVSHMAYELFYESLTPVEKYLRRSGGCHIHTTNAP